MRLSSRGETIEMIIISYEHYGKRVFVRDDLKGRHKEHCLCHSCAKFLPGKSDHCPIAHAAYEHCLKFNTITLIWECPEFQPRGDA